MNIWQVIDRYGIAIAGLVALALFIWKVLWPSNTKLVDVVVEQAKRSEIRLDKATSEFMEALKEREKRESKMVDDFIGSLDKRDKVTERIVDRLDRIDGNIDRKRAT